MPTPILRRIDSLQFEDAHLNPKMSLRDPEELHLVAINFYHVRKRLSCLNLDQLVNTAIKRCRHKRWTHASVLTNARFAQPVSRTCCITSAPTAVADLLAGQSGPQETGGTIIFWERIRQAQQSGTGRSIPRHMPNFASNSTGWHQKIDRFLRQA
jgi:hypothetical protein